jgi:hypothetical protein
MDSDNSLLAMHNQQNQFEHIVSNGHNFGQIFANPPIGVKNLQMGTVFIL